MKAFIIAAPHSGSGKTTVTLGILEILKRRGFVVAPFKVGPDFIDGGYHRAVTGRPSINLDGWMCGPDFVRETFARHTKNADVAVIEGVMGLFDGIGGNSDEGSTAQIAKLLGVPVILVVDARGQARSLAALVKGFSEFDPDVRLAGVILNHVGSAAHAGVLREAIRSSCPGVEIVGSIGRQQEILLPSRHLGLVTVDENPLSPYYLHNLARLVGGGVDLDLLLRLAESTRAQPAMAPVVSVEARVPIAVARDSAFCFVYEDNLRLLREAGAELETFSPINDSRLPEDAAGLYLPGGYPELFAEPLAANFAMKNAVRAAIEQGMPVYAECGGFIYLTRGVLEPEGLAPRRRTGSSGVRHFVGIYPVTTKMLPQRKALGYREITTTAETVLGPAGMQARGHEFHYSEMEGMPPEVGQAYRVSRRGEDMGSEGYLRHNCLASYVHLHFGSNPAMAAAFVESCRKFPRRT
ncbi:cobyrinate a,c-diamide synthase [Geobacter sp. DSM 9736]|uniref:cobyrinate a,c-diamide synthase n=1 Tax=Geobacter sp. DSM 9736 TaxID=1277350 RepID=UPI000B50E56B|nr:cobyrinate a,c-diamide synthase [Geobacter sp. DSM 9736]SNB46988.1 hydrogenobyrinic acid a,c-diamide synthase (glutamine-hydrolysing) /cobyrinate a,c-diamide synthase [Geobacter sp. DSM 9736]